MPSLEDVIYAETREEISRADNKASMLLAGTTAVTGALIALLGSSAAQLADWSTLRVGLTWLGFTLALVALVSLSAAVYPRLRRSQTASSHSIFYFADVSRHTEDELLAYFGKASDHTKTARTIHQLGVIAEIVKTKYRLIQVALWTLGAALVTGLVSVFC